MGHLLKNKERIQKFKETGDTSYICKKELDKTCFQHDVSYGDFKDLARTTASDKVLIDKAFNIAKNRKYDWYQRGYQGKWWRRYVYIYGLFYFAQINTTKTQLGLVIIFQIKIRECLSDFLSLTNILRVKEMAYWSKLLKFGRDCSNWPDKIGINTKLGESTIFKATKEWCWPQEKLKHTKTAKYSLVANLPQWT